MKKKKANMKGFKSWYVRVVKKEYSNRPYRELKELHESSLMNCDVIELPGYMTKSGKPERW